MNVYPLSPELRRRWCVASGITDVQILPLRTVRPTGRLGKSSSAELAAANITTLADLALCLPEEILSVGGIGPTTLFDLQSEIADRIESGPLIADLTDEDIARLAIPDTLEHYRTYLPADLSHLMNQAGLTGITDLAKASPVDLMANGFTLKQVRICRRCLECGLERRGLDEHRRAYFQRPLPPGLAEMPVDGSRLMLSWVGDLLVKEGSTTIGTAMTSLPKAVEDRSEPVTPEVLAKAFHIGLAARRLIATLPGGEALYRVPYWDPIAPERPPLFGALTPDEVTFLDQARCDPWEDLTIAQEQAFENGAHHREAGDPPRWIDDASAYGLDTLGFIVDAGLPYLFQAADERKDVLCDMIIAVRRALIDRAQPGLAEAVYGPEHPYLRFVRAFAKAA